MSLSGHLTRERDPDDGRVVRVRLTRAGARLHDSAARIAASVACRTQLPVHAIDSMRDQLQAFVRVMDRKTDLLLE